MIEIYKKIRREGSFLQLASKAFRQPGRALTAIKRLMRSDWVGTFVQNQTQWENCRNELAKNGILDTGKSNLSSAFSELSGNTIRGKGIGAGGVKPLHGEMLWALVRTRKPEVIVETGVCNGLSSSIILEALELNGTGRLVSVDLPEFSDPELNTVKFWEGKGGAVIPAGRAAGWLVPADRKHRWNLELGKSSELLDKIFADTGKVDIFIHDSEHSYENQMFEFTEGFKALKSGGVLVATDINWSDAFDDFWEKIKASGAKMAFVDNSCALVLKP